MRSMFFDGAGNGLGECGSRRDLCRSGSDRLRGGNLLKPYLRNPGGAGRPGDISQARPGDLIFYASGGRIDHAAIYMDNGQIIHASTEKAGIKISRWDHRKPVKAVDVIN